MSAEANLYSALTARAALTALVGNRIFPDVIPEDCALPAIVYQRASTSPVTTVVAFQFFSRLAMSKRNAR